MTTAGDRRHARLDGVVDNASKGDIFATKLKLSTGDSRNIQEIVDEADHVCQLTIHHLTGLKRLLA